MYFKSIPIVQELSSCLLYFIFTSKNDKDLIRQNTPIDFKTEPSGMGADLMFENQVHGSLCLTVYDDVVIHSTQHNCVHPKNFMMKVYTFIDLL